MKLTPITPDLSQFPREYHPVLTGSQVFDSSSSPDARVWYIACGEGLYLKAAPAGTLAEEAAMTECFHKHGLGAEVLSYSSGEKDWLLTRRIPGEDCIHPIHLEDPRQLCDTVAETLRRLHSLPLDATLPNRTAQALLRAERCWHQQSYDPTLFPDNWGFASPEEAWLVIQEHGHLLRSDTLIHGDYCLPNIVLDNWRFTGFVDVGAAGIGDRHFDLFWGIWSLGYNLKTDCYTDRFLDAYGREAVEQELLRVVAACEAFG